MTGRTELGEVLESFVSDLVRNGRYRSRSEVLRDGVRLVEERERQLATLDAAIGRSLADAEEDRVTPAEIVEARLVAKYEAMPKA